MQQHGTEICLSDRSARHRSFRLPPKAGLKRSKIRSAKLAGVREQCRQARQRMRQIFEVVRSRRSSARLPE
jgi:hypothetical protein